MSIFDAIHNQDFHSVQGIIEINSGMLHIKDHPYQRTPLDCAISCGNLEITKFLSEKGGQPNLDGNLYCDGKWTPVHEVALCGYTKTLKWILTEKVLPLYVFNIKYNDGWTPLDIAIAEGKLEIAKHLWEIGGRPNTEIYCDRNFSSVHCAAKYGYVDILKWIVKEKVLPRSAFQFKDRWEQTPLNLAIHYKKYRRSINFEEIIAFLQRLIHVDPVFLAMQRAKRDHECVLRRLPNELLDMVVDVVASRFHLEVEW